MLRNDLLAWCKEPGYDLWESGLKIYTTIDSRMQQYAAAAVVEKWPSFRKEFEKQWKACSKNPWADDNGVEMKDSRFRKIKRSEIHRSLADRYGARLRPAQAHLNLKREMTVFTWKGERDTLFSYMRAAGILQGRFLQNGPQVYGS